MGIIWRVCICSLLVLDGGAVATGEALRTVDLVDFASWPGCPRQHRGSVVERTFEKEGDVDYAHITYKVPPGWASYNFTVPVPAGTSHLELRWRAPDGKELGAGLTLTDSAGQSYQFSSRVPAGPNWGVTRIDLSSKPHNAFGGKNGKPDGVIHFPITEVALDFAQGKAVDIAGYRAVTTANVGILPDFAIRAEPAKRHALWYPEDTPSYTLGLNRRAADVEIPVRIEWTLTDFWNDEQIAAGTWTRGNGPLTFGPGVLKRRFGSFRLSLAAGEGEGRVKRDVWFARLTGPDPEPCRWIGSIGGGESWDLFRAMGVGTMNTSVGWNLCEPEKGVYVFPQWFDNYVTNMLAHGIKLHAMTHCANPLYENPLDPEAFAKYAAAYARHLWSLGVDGVEIWNEPRGVFRRQYGEDKRVSKFVEFSRMARDAIKAAVPEMTVMVCAEDMGFDLLPMIGLGIAQPGDAITFHPYCHTQPRPERSYFFNDNGRSIRNLAKERCGTTRFRISEFGWTTYTGEGEYLEIAGSYPRASYEHQAQYLVRNYIISRQCGVDYACQYRFDDMHRRNYTEHNFGFVFEDYTPKPSFCAVAFMARLLGKAEPAGALSDDLDRYRVSSFVRGGRRILACWAVEKPVEWTLPANFGKIVKCFDLMGNEIKPPFVKDRTLRLTERPFYIIGEK